MDRFSAGPPPLPQMVPPTARTDAPVRIRRALNLASPTRPASWTSPRFLADREVEILSTGRLRPGPWEEAGIPVKEVSPERPDSPREIMDGRVKTLHPKDPRRPAGPARQRGPPWTPWPTTGIPPIDLLAVNLYPFEETVARGADLETTIENIDIGGPAMIRAAAKNHAFRRGS